MIEESRRPYLGRADCQRSPIVCRWKSTNSSGRRTLQCFACRDREATSIDARRSAFAEADVDVRKKLSAITSCPICARARIKLVLDERPPIRTRGRFLEELETICRMNTPTGP